MSPYSASLNENDGPNFRLELTPLKKDGHETSERQNDSSMNTEIVTQAARATLDGSMPFPEVVHRLIETGVEYYHVDYVALRKSFYSAGGDVVTTPITYEGLPPVATDFDAAGLRGAILDSQRHGQHYRDFTRRAMQAGVQGYIAFLRGQRVTYWGRGGDQHTEWFPGASPTGSQ
jgi:uncharacterized protein YbcV (DUF1398 family)